MPCARCARPFATVTVEVGGGAVAVLAAAGRRLAYRHARIRLAEPRVDVRTGRAEHVSAAAGQYLSEVKELVSTLAAITGWPPAQVASELSAVRTLTADDAREVGLIHEIIGPTDHLAP
jgi:ATP-dependent Clp protease protease subunit